MIKNFLFFLEIILLFICPGVAYSQETFPPVNNIFKMLKSDTSKSVQTLKKTETIRINAVQMKGESKLHKHPDAEHTILLIKGVIHAEIDGRKIILREGDIISIPAGMPHKYTIKKRKAIIVSMDAPYYDPDKTILLE